MALRRLLKAVDSVTRSIVDQTLYVSIVSATLRENVGLRAFERRELAEWTATAAYESGDFQTASSILESIEEPDLANLAMLASCLGEDNRHHAAIRLADEIEFRAGPTDDDARLVAGLIRIANFFAIGERARAAELHSHLLHAEAEKRSNLFGFVMRFSEIVVDFPHCTADLLSGAELLDAAGFHKSAAYSKLSGAVHLAYSGDVDSARALLGAARKRLTNEIRDRAILANNAVAIELLSQSPDLTSCIDELNSVICTVRDDFSRVVLHINRLICLRLIGDVGRARRDIDLVERILSSPKFGNTDIFWNAYFNIWAFFRAIGDVVAEKRVASRFGSLIPDCPAYQSYWDARLGQNIDPPPEFSFLMRFDFHPEYISHWQLDAEGFRLLRTEFVR